MAATRNRPSPRARGYDEAHRTQARRLHAAHIDGTPCWWCGFPMFRDRKKNPDYDPNAMRRDGKPDTTSGVLHAEHEDGKDAGPANRLMHGLCNKQRQDGRHDDERPALFNTGATHPLGDNLTMGWPT